MDKEIVMRTHTQTLRCYSAFKKVTLSLVTLWMNLEGTMLREMNHTWTKPKRGRTKVGRWGWLGWGGVVGGKWRQLYLNNNKKCGKRKEMNQTKKEMISHICHI